MSIVRVLALPRGRDKDHDGRELGSDHMLAITGEDADGTTRYLTTDRVITSRFCDIDEIQAGCLAYVLAALLNEHLCGEPADIAQIVDDWRTGRLEEVEAGEREPRPVVDPRQVDMFDALTSGGGS